MAQLEINLELTPNPNTLKYALNRPIYEHGSVFMRSPEEAVGRSPLAAKLFALEGIDSVFIGPDFVTIGLSAKDNLRALNQDVMTTIRDHLAAGESVATPPPEGSEDDDELSRRIRAIIDQEIRPAVARDGGDVLFERFQDGIVFLHLQGACSGCPSAAMTLKLGIEARLKEELAEVEEVMAVN